MRPFHLRTTLKGNPATKPILLRVEAPRGVRHSGMKQEASTEDRDAIAAEYFERLEFCAVPVQEEALLAWVHLRQGVLVCAPTGTERR